MEWFKNLKMSRKIALVATFVVVVGIAMSGGGEKSTTAKSITLM